DIVSLKATLSSYDTDIRQAGSVDFVLANGTVLASVPTSAATNAPNGREYFVNINSGLLASRLRVGTISVQAVYNSTGLLGVYPRAYSQARTFTLSAQPTVLVATPPAAPIVLGSSSVISASVSPSIVATDFPFGIGNVILYEGSTVLQTKSVTDAMRTVTFSTASLSVGRHVLNLQYTGDGLNYQGSRSTTFAINIEKVDPDVSVVSSKSVTALGQSTLVTATIGGSVASTGAKPSGVVQFMQGTVVLGSAVLVNGKAALNFAPKRVETASITARYLGDANFATDTSSVNVVSVGRAPYMVVAAQVGSTIKTFDAKTKALIASFQPLGAGYTGGFRVAKGDVNGDNVPDFVVTANTGSVVRVYDGQSQKLAGSFTSFANSFALPVSLAIADINGDGRGDVVVAPGGVVLNPQVRVFSGNGYQLLKSMPAFTPGYKGAVSLAVGDVDGDGKADIVCAPGSGGSAAISVFSGVSGLALASFADIKTPVGGATVAVGDLTGDGKAEIVLAAFSGPSRVTVYDGASRTVLSSFQAFGTATSGARVTFGTDLNQDGQPELVVGSGVGGNSQVRRFNALNGQLVDAFFAFAAGSKERNGGLFVA
ncbi:MAG: FG-GAP-like repeat-containing protein, partial [Gemmataceae bacterium]